MKRKLLITGSRQASTEMLLFVDLFIAQVAVRGNVEIIVGDAGGIDERVVMSCQARKIPYTVYGVKPQPRLPRMREIGKWDMDAVPYEQVAYTVRAFKIDWRETYLNRDRVMADRCDTCVAIWNGESLASGTMATARYVHDRRKAVNVVNFGTKDYDFEHLRRDNHYKFDFLELAV